jgi:hypothetical protein
VLKVGADDTATFTDHQDAFCGARAKIKRVWQPIAGMRHGQDTIPGLRFDQAGDPAGGGEAVRRTSFEATSINEIAEAAGLSKAGIYHYFESKTEILRVMLTEHLESVTEIVDTALNTSDAPRDKFLTPDRAC